MKEIAIPTTPMNCGACYVHGVDTEDHTVNGFIYTKYPEEEENKANEEFPRARGKELDKEGVHRYPLPSPSMQYLA